MLTKNIVEFLYEAASMQRWNDHIRVEGFSELDKQAHKAMILYVLAKYEEDAGAKVDWQKLIEGLLFEYIYRSFLTDIKPPVFHELVRECGRELNSWVYQEVAKRLPDLDGQFSGTFKSGLTLIRRRWRKGWSVRHIIWPPSGSFPLFTA